MSRVHLSTNAPIAIVYMKRPIIINGYKNDYFVYNLSPNENIEAKLAKVGFLLIFLPRLTYHLLNIGDRIHSVLHRDIKKYILLKNFSLKKRFQINQ